LQQESLCIAVWNGEVWEKLTCLADAEDQAVSAHLTHFSLYALIGEIDPSTSDPSASSSPAATIPPAAAQEHTPSVGPQEPAKAGELTTLPVSTESAPAQTQLPAAEITDPSAGQEPAPPVSTYMVIMIVLFVVVVIGTVYYIMRRIYLNR
jgi:cobalamin biosynthesis Mg chelatase CobN